MQNFPTPLWVVAGALVRSDGALLLHRRPPHKHHGGLWEFPGGKLEPGELPREALARELAEELAISCEPSRLEPFAFADSHDADRPLGTVILLYTVSDWSGVPQAMEEGAMVGWFHPDKFCALPMPPLDIDMARAFSKGAWSGKICQE